MRTRFWMVLAVCSIGCDGAMDGRADDGIAGGKGDAPGQCVGGGTDIPLIGTADGPTPEVLIVLDRSGSMGQATFPTFTPAWELVLSALEKVTVEFDQRIEIGLSMFPSDAVCGVSAGTAVDIGLGHSDAVVEAMEANPPGDGGTPADQALSQALAVYQSLPEAEGGRFVLFATDGVPNCNDDVDPSTATVDSIDALAEANIKTLVLGINHGFFSDFGTVLNAAAEAGGSSRPNGPPFYYAASNAEELETALTQISARMLPPSCSFELASPPANLGEGSVTIDGDAIPRDTEHHDGWDYHSGNKTISLYGDACDRALAADLPEVSFASGCD